MEPFLSKAAPAFLVQYPYGDEVVQEGRFQVPCHGPSRCVSCSTLVQVIESASVSIPLSLVVRGAVEAFLPLKEDADGEAPSRPMRMLGIGEFFGVFETLDTVFGQSAKVPLWGVSAGARSVLVLASRMSDRTQRWLLERGKLKRRELPEFERIERDGWKLVRHLIADIHRTDSPGWATEVVVLPGATGRRLRTDLTAAPALLRIAEIGWVQSRHLREHLIDEESLVLNKYLVTRSAIHRKDRISMVGVLRQILAMARGELPAYAPAASEAVLPLSLFRQELAQSPDRRTAIVVVPKHLEGAGDTAYVSVKFNFLPAQSSKAPRVFRAFCTDIEQALPHLPGNFLDLSETKFLNKEDAIEELKAKSGISAKVSSRHPFLTGCLRLVRAR